MRTFFFLCFFIGTYILYAQPHDTEHFDIERGLSNNYVVSLTQDRHGTLWIATEAGLNRFDGHTFVTYTQENSGLSSNELNIVMADPADDKIWIGTQRDGLCCFDYKTESITHLFRPQHNLLTNDITDLSPAAAGGIWVTHYHYGIDHYNPRTQTFTPYSFHRIPALKNHQHWTAVDDGKGHLYIGHDGQGMSILSLKDSTVIAQYRHDPTQPHSLPGNRVYALCIDRQQRVWIGTDNGVALFDPDKKSLTTFTHQQGNPRSLLPGEVRDICLTDDGHLWIATDGGGISTLDSATLAGENIPATAFKNIIPDKADHLLTGAHIRAILQDASGNVWIGHYRDGLDFISYAPPLFHTLEAKNQSRPTSNLYHAQSSLFWLGEGNTITAYRKRQAIATLNLPETSSRPTYITAVGEDRQGHIWIGTNNGDLYITSTGSSPKKNLLERAEKYSITPNTPAGATETAVYIYCFYQDHRGKMWIGTQNGLYSYENKKLVYETTITRQLKDRTVTAIQRDRAGQLWVGTFGRGLFIFDSKGHCLTHLSNSQRFPSNAINDLMTDSQSRIWAATRNGIVLFTQPGNPETYLHFNSSQDLESNHVHALLEDTHGNIWVNTNQGISRWDQQQQRFYNYTRHDGVLAGDFMNASACMDRDGFMYFGSTDGICYFHPDTLTNLKNIAPITITGAAVCYQASASENAFSPLPLTSTPDLPYRLNGLRFTFNIPDYTRNREVEFAYRLSGGEDDRWHSVGHEHQVTFHSLPQGEYTFEVRARFPHQEWQEDTASLSFTIRPPFWLTGGAIFGYILILCAFFTGLYIHRKYKRALSAAETTETETTIQATEDAGQTEASPAQQPETAVTATPSPAPETDAASTPTHHFAEPVTPRLTRLDEDFLNRLTTLILDNLQQEKLDMAFIAEHMGMSHSTLYRRIKNLTGMSGNEFIRKTRLAHSLRLMVEDGYNISEAAYASGFNDLSYYRTCFKDAYGMTPSEYKSKLKSPSV